MKKWNIDEGSFNAYINACIDAATNEELFNNFKRNQNYTTILEHQHVPKEYGDLMISYIENKYDKEKLISKIDNIKDNDKYGNPILYNFDYGYISLGTLRYVKNSCDIVSYFGEDNINTIVEIGGGYGGLCKTISNFIDYKNYHIYDLKEVNLLTSKYLSKFNNFDRIHINTLEDNNKIFIDGEIDLLISNYAFSELPKSLQVIYINEVILKCNKFYMIYNHLQSGSENGLKFNEFIDILSNKYDMVIEDDIDESLVKIIYGCSKKKNTKYGKNILKS